MLNPVRSLLRKAGLDVIRPKSVKPKHQGQSGPLVSWLKKSLRRFNLELVPYRMVRGLDAMDDINVFLSGIPEQVMLDVGANAGQSVMRFRERFPGLSIHSFEPCPSTFSSLRKNCRGLDSVTTWNLALGAKSGRQHLFENTLPGMNSLFVPGPTAFGDFQGQVEVAVTTVDEFAVTQSVKYVHILKSDAQGSDLDVLKGAENLIANNQIGLIYVEFIFSEMYKSLPTLDELFSFLNSRGFLFVGFYQPHYQNDLVSWADLLFVSRALYEERSPEYQLRPSRSA